MTVRGSLTCQRRASLTTKSRAACERCGNDSIGQTRCHGHEIDHCRGQRERLFDEAAKFVDERGELFTPFLPVFTAAFPRGAWACRSNNLRVTGKIATRRPRPPSCIASEARSPASLAPCRTAAPGWPGCCCFGVRQ